MYFQSRQTFLISDIITIIDNVFFVKKIRTSRFAIISGCLFLVLDLGSILSIMNEFSRINRDQEMNENI